MYLLSFFNSFHFFDSHHNFPVQLQVVFAVIRVVTALFLQETLANAANDADMQLENSRRLAMEYQAKLEAG